MEEVKLKKRVQFETSPSFLKPYWYLNVTFAENKLLIN